MATSKSDTKLTVLRRRVARVPTEPGVYRWLDAEGSVLYVGKAKNLKNRMQTYVQDGLKRSAWTEIMVRQIADFEVSVVRSELEAFMLEANLIKELKPKYNIMLKDDKGYVYVRISLYETYPRVEMVRRIGADKAKYYGPFTSGGKNTEQALAMLDSILHFQSCSASLDALNAGKPAPGSPCLDYQIGKCSGLCIGSVSQEEYRSRIAEVEKFFRGNFSSAKKRTQEAMRQAAADQKFERAAKLRDVLRFIEGLEAKQVISDTSGDDADIFGIALLHGKTQVVLLKQRDGKLIDQLSFALKGEADSAADALAQFLPQYYRETQDIPASIILGETFPEAETLAAWLKELKGTIVRILIPERGKKSKLLLMAERNAVEKVEQQFAAWEAEHKKVEGALAELATLLHLPAPPRRIEGYDISHLGGTATVGSMVVFINGKAKRDHYRSFNMKTVQEGAIDDYKSIRETLMRRLRYLKDGLREHRATLESQGITIGKAKKNEQKSLEEIIARYPGTLGPERIEYKDFLVVRSASNEIVALASLHEDRAKLLEIDPVWVSDSYRGRRLGLLLVQLLLQKQNKKVYLLCKPDLEEYYASIGFQAVREVPEYLATKVHEYAEEFHQPPEMVMMIEPRKSKPDASFLEKPDLLLIDGGKGQLSAAKAVLDSYGLTIPVAGLAKREEEIFLPSSPVSLAVRDGSEARFLLQRLRDEAHRFANDRRERRLSAILTASRLDAVPGIGDATRVALLKKFGSADGVIAASDEELRTVLSEVQVRALRMMYPRG